MLVESIILDPQWADVSWSIDVRYLDVSSNETLYAHDASTLLKTASVAKLFLLEEVAARLQSGRLDSRDMVDRRAVAPVADSGLWQHLDADSMTISDACRLVGTVSDNLAANVLIDLVGLESVQARAAARSSRGSTLHDIVRDHRAASNPSTLSVGAAGDWADFFVTLWAGRNSGDPVGTAVLDWIRTSSDHSMVAAGLGLDPLSHGADESSSVHIWNKTGTDDGVRADAGLIAGPGATTAYAVVCNWDVDGPDRVHDVLQAMRSIGEELGRIVQDP